jgi:hypothetical protein
MRPLLWLLAGTAGCFYVVDPNVRVESIASEGEVHRIVIDADAGKVDLHGANRSDVGGTATIWWGAHEPNLHLTEADGVLTVVVDCRPAASVCSVDLDLAVPYGVQADVRTGAGEVVVLDIDEVLVDTGSGSVSVDGIAGDVTIESGSGGLAVDHVGGDVTAETGSGGITGGTLLGDRLVFETGSGSIDLGAAGFTLLDAQTGSGSIEIAVPEGAYDVDAHTGSGSIDVHGLIDDPEADSQIYARTGSGSIAIRGTRP